MKFTPKDEQTGLKIVKKKESARRTYKPRVRCWDDMIEDDVVVATATKILRSKNERINESI